MASRRRLESICVKQATIQMYDGSWLLLTAASVLFIIYMTLFPFDFRWDSVDHSIHQFVLARLQAASFVDPLNFVGNVLLFIPLGFCLGLRLSARKGADLLLFVLAIGVGLSALVEGLQIWLLIRTPSIADIVANGIGALLGASLARWWTLASSRHGGYLLGSRLTGRPLPLFLLLTCYAAYLVAICTLTIGLRHAMRLSNWDLGYHLALGNETTGDRTWRGNISDVLFLDRAISQQEALCLLADGCTLDIDEGALVGAYRLHDPTDVSDRSGQLPDLEWRTADDTVSASELRIGMGRSWLETTTPAATLSQRYSTSSSFSLIATATSVLPRQSGPARIITLSDGPYARNLTVGQSGDDLSIRVRTPLTGDNGVVPQFYVPNLLEYLVPQRFAVVFQGNRLAVYSDGGQRVHQLDLSPRTMLFRYISPVKGGDYGGWEIGPSSFQATAFSLYYNIIMLAPLAILVASIHHERDGRCLIRRGALKWALILIAPLCLELSLGSAAHVATQIASVFFGIGVMISVVSLVPNPVRSD